MASGSGRREDRLSVFGAGGLHQLVDDGARGDHVATLYGLQLQDIGGQQRRAVQTEPELVSGDYVERK